jgi:hypothetical protein
MKLKKMKKKMIGLILLALSFQMEMTLQNSSDLFEIEVIGAFRRSWGGYPIQPNATVTYTIDDGFYEKTGFKLKYNGKDPIFLTNGEIWQVYSAEGETWEYEIKSWVINLEMNKTNSVYYFLIEKKIYVTWRPASAFLELTDDLGNNYLLEFEITDFLNTISIWPMTQGISCFFNISTYEKTEY